ncbi:DUF4263 domain-containing protein [Candidatus Parcubacteria bacterium]|nr:DUF4263 domain-containing protein [Candidatus Parcubacteria bacterium]
MNIEIKKEKNKIFLYYHIEDTEWLLDVLDEYKIKQTFLLAKKLTVFGKDIIKLEIAKLRGDYYCFYKRVLDINYNVYFAKDYLLETKYFVISNYVRPVSIFKAIEKINDNRNSIYIGGNKDGSIPFEIFNEMIKKFPNSYELMLYKQSRIEIILEDYLSKNKSYSDKYQKYLKLKEDRELNRVLTGIDVKLDLKRVKFLKEELEQKLNNPVGLNENEWQKIIFEIIKLLYPKYILVLNKIEVKDPYYNGSGKAKTDKREIDIALLDVDGNVDIIEIKIPDVHILSNIEYRNNFYPLRELSGAVMQLEKYIFYLNKGGIKLEQKIKKKYSSRLPKKFDIKIVNPRGIIIAGRSDKWDERQKKDFEIIKRKYKNFVDILTYDDLLSRLSNLFFILSSQNKIKNQN